MEPKTKRYVKEAEKLRLEFSKVLIPPNMRSRYWKYFGFPADDEGEIITKEQIVCTLCSTPINFHRNTTNLRSHLFHHKDEVEWSDEEFNQDFFSRTPKTSKSNQRFAKSRYSLNKRNTLYKNDEKIPVYTIKTVEESIASEDNQSETEHEAVISFEGTDIITDEAIKNDDNSIVLVTSQLPAKFDLTNSILKMITNDILPTSIVEGEGFKNLIWNLCGNLLIPNKNEVEEHIVNIYEEKYLKLHQILEKYTVSHPFSLGIEIWHNNEKKTLVSFYFNYILPEHPTTLNSVLFQTVELSKYTNLEEVFKGINLKKCTCAIINSYNNVVANFLSIYGIVTINCLHAVIQRCLKLVFSIPEINQLFADIQDLLYKHPEVTSNLLHMPKIDESFPWTKYEFLNYFYDNVQDNSNIIMHKAKTILDCLNSIKLTIETLINEPNPLASLVKPLAFKLTEQHLLVDNDDSELAAQIKNLLSTELRQNLLSNTVFIMASFFDPRFHQFIQEDEMNIIYEKVENKGSEMSEISQNSSASSSMASKSNITDNQNQTRSILKLFFDDSKSKSSNTSKISAEQEIIKYKNEAYADLEQCPLEWWWRMGYSYKHLKHLAEDYNCVSSCINNNFKKSIEEQIDQHYRRLILRNSDLINKILFLNYNKNL